MAFKGILCCGNLSFNTEDKDVSEENDREVIETQKKKLTKAELINQEMDELDQKIQMLTNSLNVLEDKYEDTEHQIMQFFGRCVVEKLETKFFYTAPPIMVMKKRNDGTIFPSFREVTDENENTSVTEPSPAYSTREENILGASGLLNVRELLKNRQAVLHQQILTTVDIPFRVILGDIMLRNRCIEGHAKFLCINLLMSISYLHSRNIIHGNITPTSVIFTQFGYPCLIDVERDETGEDTSGAQPCIEYTSPEQVKDEPVSAATDIFLIGILVYSTMYGKSPFKADTYSKTRANILDETFIPEFDLDTISKDGRLFIRKLLKMNPDSRFKLDSCMKPLDKAVKWFSTMSQQELKNQSYPSPFKEFLMKRTQAD